jgi:ABC-2 type transport system ATP-binding protein
MPEATVLPVNAIEVRGLEKTYAGSKKAPPKVALRGVDLVIPRGSMFGLLGPNGAGKSTLINILAGVVNKTGGTAEIWGRDIDRQPRDARAALGVVPQEIVADVFFTPRESLEVQAGFYGVPASERRSDELLEALGLSDKAHAYVRALSGGMKRRLMVAKALVHNPPILILDEPTAGVDVELRRQLWEYVRRLNAEGVTILLTTHYLEEAQELCDTIAIMNRGEVVACEPTPQLLRRLDTRNVVVTPGNPLKALPELKGFDAVARPNGAFAITYKKGLSSVEQVLAAVRAAGVTIADIVTEDPDLEDVFLALTYGDDRQASPTRD